MNQQGLTMVEILVALLLTSLIILILLQMQLKNRQWQNQLQRQQEAILLLNNCLEARLAGNKLSEKIPDYFKLNSEDKRQLVLSWRDPLGSHKQLRRELL